MTYSKCVDQIRSALIDLAVLAERDKFKYLDGMLWQANKMVDVLRMLLRTHGKV